MDACDAREGASGQGDMVTRGSEGRDAVAPLPNPIQGTSWQGDTVTRGDARTARSAAPTRLKLNFPYLVMNGRSEAWHQSL